MTNDQSVTHIRGDDLKIPVTVTLDQSRTLDGAESWTWTLRRTVQTVALATKTSPSGVTIDGSTSQPTIVLVPADFPISTFPESITDQTYIHELQMVKDTKTETVMRGIFTLTSDVVR